LQTFGQKLDANHGAGPGFDLLRITLAGAILWAHTNWIFGSTGHLAATINGLFGFAPHHPEVMLAAVTSDHNAAPPLDGLTRPYAVSLVPMFFGLSGFLVTGSAIRTKNVVRFLGLRVLRILPALVVEVVLSALIFGVFLTDLPPRSYFSSLAFYRYFGNMVGWITFRLPGVFDNNHVHLVNANLWTLPSELDCYIIMGVLIGTGVLFRRMLITTVLAVVTIVLLALNTFTNFAVTPEILAGHTITYYFFVGVAFYHWRSKIAYSLPFFVVSCVLTYVLSLSRHTIYLSPVFLVYITIYLGLTNFPSSRLLKSGDYSYGVYLYGFPIAQALWAAVPPLRGQLWGFRIASLSLTMIFAAASWHLVEKHVLKLKKYLIRDSRTSAYAAPVESYSELAAVSSKPQVAL